MDCVCLSANLARSGGEDEAEEEQNEHSEERDESVRFLPGVNNDEDQHGQQYYHVDRHA